MLPKASRTGDITRHANWKKITDTLIENNLRRHAGIGTAQNDGERFLAALQPITAVDGLMQVLGIGSEPGVAFAQGVQLAASAGRIANRARSRLACTVLVGPKHFRNGKRAKKHDP
jgi:hypothetical protein